MKNRRPLLIALGIAVFVALAAWLGLSATSGWRDRAESAEEEIADRRTERRNRLCASSATYDRLKELVFDEAVRARAADPANLDTLAASAVVRMENPVVSRGDQELGETLCEGRFVLELPPGAERALAGERRLAAEIRYGVQTAADGSGLVYRIEGAEPIVARLAAFDLAGAQLPSPPVELPPVTPAPAAPAPPAPGFAPPREIVQPLPRKAAPPVPRPAPVASARPSFNCRYARTRGERLICASPQLAAADRAMSSLYFSAIAEADPATKRRIRASRDPFLRARDRCPNAACVADIYDQRIDEIAAIASGQ